MSKQDPRRFYTYAYIRGVDSQNGRKGSPYYIGKGCHKRAWIDKGRPARKPTDESRIVMLRTNLTEQEAFDWERFYIKRYGRLDLGTGILHNKTDGGDGVSGIIIPESARRVHRENRQKEGRWKGAKNPTAGGDPVRGEKNPMWGRSHTQEARRKMSETRLIKNQDPRRKNEIKIARLRYLYELIDADGEVYVTENLLDFSRQYSLNNSCIHKVVTGKQASYKGWAGRILERLR